MHVLVFKHSNSFTILNNPILFSVFITNKMIINNLNSKFVEEKKTNLRLKFHCYNVGQAMGVRSFVAVTTSPWKRQFPADRTNIFPKCSGIGKWNTIHRRALKFKHDFISEIWRIWLLTLFWIWIRYIALKFARNDFQTSGLMLLLSWRCRFFFFFAHQSL